MKLVEFFSAFAVSGLWGPWTMPLGGALALGLGISLVHPAPLLEPQHNYVAWGLVPVLAGGTFWAASLLWGDGSLPTFLWGALGGLVFMAARGRL